MRDLNLLNQAWPNAVFGLRPRLFFLLIYRIGQDDPAKLRGWKKYVFPIYTAYNGKCRKDALPMKF